MKEVFSIAPASTSWSWLLPLLIMVPVILLQFYFFYAPRNIRFEVSPEGLRIRGDVFYSRFVPARDLDLAAARPVDLHLEPSYRPAWRTNGVGLPGYQGGWFQLSNGDKALVFVGDKKRVVHIPTRAGHSLLLSVADGPRFVESLRGMVVAK